MRERLRYWANMSGLDCAKLPLPPLAPGLSVAHRAQREPLWPLGVFPPCGGKLSRPMITGKVSPSLGGAIMFKKIVAASLAAGTMAASAYAADLRAPAPYVPPPPVFSWTGAYIGLNAGGIFSQRDQNGNGVFAVPGFCSPVLGGCAAVPNDSTLIANGINQLGFFNNNNNNRGG